MQVFKACAQRSITTEVIEETRCYWQQRRSWTIQWQICPVWSTWALEDKEAAERSEAIFERPLMCDASCQIKYNMTDDEPAEAAVVDEPESLCEGNPDAKFRPLILKYQSVLLIFKVCVGNWWVVAFLLIRIISGSLFWPTLLNNSSCEMHVETSRGDFRN